MSGWVCFLGGGVGEGEGAVAEIEGSRRVTDLTAAGGQAGVWFGECVDARDRCVCEWWCQRGGSKGCRLLLQCPCRQLSTCQHCLISCILSRNTTHDGSHTHTQDLHSKRTCTHHTHAHTGAQPWSRTGSTWLLSCQMPAVRCQRERPPSGSCGSSWGRLLLTGRKLCG